MGRIPTTNSSKPVYYAIRKFLDENGYSPSIRDLADMTGLAKSNVLYHVRKLHQSGYINCVPFIARSITIRAEIEEGEEETR